MSAVATSWTNVPTDAGDMPAYLAVPPAGSGPGIVMLQEIFGVNAAMRAKAEEFAAAGFTVLVPDLFWRLQPRVDLSYTEEDRQAGFGFMQRFDFAKGIADIAAAFRALSDNAACIGAPALVGYCLGGKLAVVAGAAIPEASAVISFYGVRLDENIEQIRGMGRPVIIHVGDNDAHIPMDTVKRLQEQLADADNVEIHVYPGAEHGFFNKMRSDVFAPEASERAWERTLRHLPKAA